MSIPRIYYQVTDKKAIEAFDDYKKQKNALLRRATKFAKTVGADPNNFYMTNSNRHVKILGFIFDDISKVDRNLWKKADDDGRAWEPKCTHVAKHLRKEFVAIGELTSGKIEIAVGWTDIVDIPNENNSWQSTVCFFSFFARYSTKNKKGFYGFSSPATKHNKNKFIKGVKEVLYSKVQKELGN